MQLTNSQLALLRSRPHQANIYLSIYRPKTLMSAQVMTGTYDTGDIQISYMNVTTGSYSNLYPDLTAMIGSEPGSDDYGRLRMRSATGTYVVFAENSINWTTGMYLTFIDQVDVQAIYPRIIQDPNSQTNVIFYKDYDIPYTNQNQIYGTFPCAGPHRAGFLSSGTFYFTATGTYNVLSEALTYSWIFEGGTPTGSTAETPGNVKWNATGDYKVTLQTTSASGAIDTTYRYVSIYNRPGGGGSRLPVLQWEMTQFSGSRSEGGYTASFKVYQDLGSVQPNAVVVLFTDNWYGGSQINLGGNAVGNSSILFVGYILGDSIKFDYQSSSVEFSVASISQLMKEAEGFSVSCESKASPTTWFELYEMNVPRAIYHYLRWHSTVLKVSDFQYTGDARLVQYFDADRGSLYDAVDSFVRGGLLGELVADRQGKLWAEISSFGLQNPITTLPNYLTVHKQDWMGSPQITERRNSELSFIELGGIAYYGVSSNTYSALISNAPSTVPLYHGKSDRKEGLILNSQAELNQVSGNYLAYNNSPFPEIGLSLNGIYTNLDIAPQERFYLVIAREDTVRNKSLQGVPFTLTGMDWKYSSVDQSLYPDVTFAQLATGTAGVTVEIPATPPDNGYSYPSLQLPPLPDFNNSQSVGSTVPMTVVFHDLTKGVVYTTNFDSNNHQYLLMNGGLTQSQYQGINSMFVCPNGAVYVAMIGFFLARAPAIGQPFTVYDMTGYKINAIGFRPDAPETVMYVTERTTGPVLKEIWMGTNGTFSKTITMASELFYGDITYANTKWLYTSYGVARLISQNGTSITNTYVPNINLHHFRGGYLSDYVISQKNDGSSNWFVSNDNFAHVTSINDASLKTDGMHVGLSPDGLQIMSRYDNPPGALRGKSNDGGFSWSFLPNLPYSDRWIWAYAGGTGSGSRWVAAGGMLKFSPDYGNTWIDKEGDYRQSVYITPNIDMVFVPGITQRNSFANYG